jgi:hypothetical protein
MILLLYKRRDRKSVELHLKNLLDLLRTCCILDELPCFFQAEWRRKGK